jgi:aldehyde dehydrogenase
MTDILSSSGGRINAMTVYARAGAEGSVLTFQSRYDNYIGGEWVAPAAGR